MKTAKAHDESQKAFELLNRYLKAHQPTSSTSIEYWIDYSTRVRDADAVLAHVLSFACEKEKPRVHLALARWYERYLKDFEKASEAYLAGGEPLLKYHKQFAWRMEQRIKRDVTDVLSPPNLSPSRASKKRQ